MSVVPFGPSAISLPLMYLPQYAATVHWDVPLVLQSFYGGFTSPNIVDDYVNYAKTIFKAFNGRVKNW
ncbi:hypothetical protein ARMGADRAFT_1015204 [Armillaria gallica]|uniref:Uncharacterized protein n=1 Tax=Armillaria gallica TaxID=47427 RepID=A0A2H3DFG2_ARMGA|nr:hypothetical protein ARMGADRAFT_1015204 [Armillaria gallica]